MHDFDKFPELTDSQLDLYYHLSPHRQILEDFTAKVKRVIDGDTVELEWYGRDFLFPLRMINIAAPETKETGGEASKNWLEKELLGEEVFIEINPKNRVERWGRLLGTINHRGIDMGELSMMQGHSVSWADRKIGAISWP